MKTVALHIPGTNTYLADGAWTHNDSSFSGPTISQFSPSDSSSDGSSSAKSSGSSLTQPTITQPTFSSDTGLTQETTGSGASAVTGVSGGTGSDDERSVKPGVE